MQHEIQQKFQEGVDFQLLLIYNGDTKEVVMCDLL